MEFSEGNTSITVITLQEREVVPPSNPVAVTTNEEVWLANLTSVINHTLHLLPEAMPTSAQQKDRSIDPTKCPSLPGTGTQEYVHSRVRSALYEENMKGFQMHLRICVGASHSSPYVSLLCAPDHVYIYIIGFLCSHVYVHTYVRMYVFMPYVLCYRHVNVHFQLTNTIVALASLHWNSYLCISLSSFFSET